MLLEIYGIEDEYSVFGCISKYDRIKSIIVACIYPLNESVSGLCRSRRNDYLVCSDSVVLLGDYVVSRIVEDYGECRKLRYNNFLLVSTNRALVKSIAILVDSSIRAALRVKNEAVRFFTELLVCVATCCRMPVIISIVAPTVLVSMNVIKMRNNNNLGCSTCRTCMKLRSIGGLCGLKSNNAYIPSVILYVCSCIGMLADSRMPVLIIIIAPGIGVGMRKLGSCIRLSVCVTAENTGSGLGTVSTAGCVVIRYVILVGVMYK
jgi:hypothetical protein